MQSLFQDLSNSTIGNHSTNIFFNLLLSHIIIFLELFGLTWPAHEASLVAETRSVALVNTGIL